jgi:uncharacterized protein YutE (UPF0331/DUF86 family)
VIDLANYVLRKRKLGIPSSSGDGFSLLADASLIPADLAERLVRMTGFRNTAIHEYQRLNMEVIISIIQKDVQDIVLFTEIILDCFGDLTAHPPI